MRVVVISALLLVGFSCSECFCSHKINTVEFVYPRPSKIFCFPDIITREEMEIEAQKYIKEEEELDNMSGVRRLKWYIKDCEKEKNTFTKCIHDNNLCGTFMLKISDTWWDESHEFRKEITNGERDSNLTEEEAKNIKKIFSDSVMSCDCASGTTIVDFVNKDKSIVNIINWFIARSIPVAKW